MFFDRGHPRFWNFYSTIPVDVVRVKSYMNSLFDPARVVMRVTINKLYFVPEWLDDCEAGVQFVNHEYDYRQNWTTLSPVTN